MRTRLLYLAVPLFTFLAVYRFWNNGPISSSVPMERGMRNVAVVYPAAMTSDEPVDPEKKSSGHPTFTKIHP